ncbi:MAG: hypothetical protein KC766_26470 [Myxococcales bacterium]|nr:hypothetical protein [Myxococcales bacterium]
MRAWTGLFRSGSVAAAFMFLACGSDAGAGGEGGTSGTAPGGSSAGGAGSAGAAGSGGTPGSGGTTGGGAGTTGATGGEGASGGSAGQSGSGGTSGGGAGAGGIGGVAGDTGGGPPQSVTVDYDFTQGLQGWSAGFADYADGTQDLQLDSGIRTLPSEVGTGKGLMIQGHNRSDDLYMFIKRSVGPEVGLRAFAKYQVTMRVRFASNAQPDCVGIGGAPGESVFLKFGTTTTNPIPVLMGGVWRMNVDKGDQGNAGPVGTLAGNIANGQAGCPGNALYESLSRTRLLDVEQRADATGVIWMLIGTDSGYEGFTQLYYQAVHATFEPVP